MSDDSKFARSEHSYMVEGPDGKSVDARAIDNKDSEECKKSQPERPIMPPFSVNNRLILQSYQKEGLKAVTTNGFSMVQQKVAVKGLKVLMRATLQINGPFSIQVNPGDIAYIKEELLHTQPWAQKVYQSDSVEGPFIIVDLVNVEFVVPQ